MRSLILLSLQLWLLTTPLASGESDACFISGDSSECAAIIRSRHNLTLEATERVRSRIQSLANSKKLGITAQGISAFEMAMGCYAIGQKLPSDIGCVSCLNCKQQMNLEVCDLFCPLPPVVPSIPVISQAAPSSSHNEALNPRDVASRTISNPSKQQPVFLILAIVGLLFLITAVIVLGFISIRLYLIKSPIGTQRPAMERRVQPALSAADLKMRKDLTKSAPAQYPLSDISSIDDTTPGNVRPADRRLDIAPLQSQSQTHALDQVIADLYPQNIPPSQPVAASPQTRDDSTEPEANPSVVVASVCDTEPVSQVAEVISPPDSAPTLGEQETVRTPFTKSTQNLEISGREQTNAENQESMTLSDSEQLSQPQEATSVQLKDSNTTLTASIPNPKFVRVLEDVEENDSVPVATLSTASAATPALNAHALPSDASPIDLFFSAAATASKLGLQTIVRENNFEKEKDQSIGVKFMLEGLPGRLVLSDDDLIVRLIFSLAGTFCDRCDLVYRTSSGDRAIVHFQCQMSVHSILQICISLQNNNVAQYNLTCGTIYA